MRVRFFAGAAEAAGRDEQPVEGGRSLAALRDELSAIHGDEFAAVLGRCSFLVDGVRADDEEAMIGDAATVDVLPPFAGG